MLKSILRLIIIDVNNYTYALKHAGFLHLGGIIAVVRKSRSEPAHAFRWVGPSPAEAGGCLVFGFLKRLINISNLNC